jgi:beta-lactamase regulating signal transducer with metallopeptidase domain
VETLLQIGLTNAVVAAGLALLAAAVGKLCRRPALAHALWLLVLLKLITPPLVMIPIALPEAADDPESPATFAARLPLEEDPAPVPLEANPAPVPEPQEEPEPSRGAAWPKGAWPVQVTHLRDPRPVPLAQAVDAGFTAAATTAPRGSSNAAWLNMLATLWLAGSVAWFSVALARIGRFQRLLNNCRAAPTELQKEASAVARQLGLRDCPRVWLVSGAVSPLLWSIAGYPRLVLPVGLLQRVDEMQRRTLLAHELAHYRRRDHWVRCLEFAALGLYWWFPLVWWARRELREAEEECCDAWVTLALPGASRAYASALVETFDFLSGAAASLPAAASGLGQLDLLRRRLTMIMRAKTSPMLGGLGFLAVLGLAVVLLPLVPSWAQQYSPAASANPAMPQAGQSTRDLEKARADLERANKELQILKQAVEALRAQFEAQRAQLEEKMAAVRKAEERALQKADEQVKRAELAEKAANGQLGGIRTGPPQGIGGYPFGGLGGGLGGQLGGLGPYGGQGGIGSPNPFISGLGGGPGGWTSTPEIEKRIADMEKKLDRVLMELRDMQKLNNK